jgi:type III secretory pathway component EscV
MNFFLFLSVLAVLYIANGHLSDKTIRNINKTQNELKELEYQYKTLKGEVMFKSEEEQVLKATEPLGLKISKEVPQRLQLEKR